MAQPSQLQLEEPSHTRGEKSDPVRRKSHTGVGRGGIFSTFRSSAPLATLGSDGRLLVRKTLT